MYTLLTGIFRQLTAENVYNILILGLDNAGKTSLYEHFKSYDPNSQTIPVTSRAPTTIPTVGLNVCKVSIQPGTQFQVWDLGGQVALRPLWDHYMGETHAVIFLIDGTDVERFTEAQHELKKILKHPLLADAPVLVGVGKQDMVGAQSPEYVASTLGIYERRPDADIESHTACVGIEGRKWRVQALSCRDGHGIREMIDWLLDVLPESDRGQPTQ